MNDPEATYNNLRLNLLVINWGDGERNRAAYHLDYPNQYLHTYTQPGTYLVSVKAFNSAGLSDIAQIQVQVD